MLSIGSLYKVYMYYEDKTYYFIPVSIDGNEWKVLYIDNMKTYSYSIDSIRSMFSRKTIEIIVE